MAKSNPCAADGCEKMSQNYQRYCGMHESRLKHHGDLNHVRVYRVVTDTEAWCNKGQHMVPHAGFAKGQNTCRDCRRIHYTRNNYSLGKTCIDCGRPINNKAVSHCNKCRGKAQRGKHITKKRRLNYQGYAIVAGEWDHPNSNNRGQVLEHVLVMSGIIGRGLLPGENVHHINGVRDDNRPENLEIWSTSQPKGQRIPDKVEWAKELLSIYEPDALVQPRLALVEEIA